jgi:3-oxoacyl-[acyl-carrier protein] reductase
MTRVVESYLLTDRVTLVSGASSGIGAATALACAELGAPVVLGYFHNEVGALTTRDRIVDAGGRAVAIKADVSLRAGVLHLVDQATQAFGRIDVLVNNAGSLIERQRLADITEARIDEVLALNFKSAVFAAQAVAPAMTARGRGAIINVVSIAGHNGGGPGAGAYAAAKAALQAMSKSLAKELAPQGVRVNAVSPGVIDTPFHEVFSTPEMIRQAVAAIPLRRLGTAAECASVIAFLASDAASYVVGETIEVNGGQLMR